MVRLSTNNDINGIISVWKEAFGDSENDIRFFLDEHFKPDNTVISECEGEVASVLFLLEGDMHIAGKDYPSYYLYAASTLKKFRGRGMMSDMLDFSKNIAYERNRHFIALKPAEESLYNYYSRFGYQSVFSKRKSFFKKTKTGTQIPEYDSDLIFSELRNNAYSQYDYFKWNKASVDFAVKHHKYYGGEIFSNRNGYILCSFDDNVLYIKENTFSREVLSDVIDYVLTDKEAEVICGEFPFEADYDCVSTEIIKSGMLLPVSEEADVIIKTLNNAYLSLTLD